MFLHLSVSHSVHRGCTAPGQPPLVDTPLPADIPLGRQPTLETATAADGMYPTGMHSCCLLTSLVTHLHLFNFIQQMCTKLTNLTE